jgi:hypothetical protein
VVVRAQFPHRKYKTVEKAIASALNTWPVERTIVVGQDPSLLRAKALQLTTDVCRRQDEVIGL